MHFHAMAGLALAFFSLSLAKDIDPKVAKDPDSQARTPLAKRQADEKPISISYLRGTLSVAAYETQEESKRANADGSKAHYAYLLLRPLPDKEVYDKVLALIGIQPLARTYPFSAHPLQQVEQVLPMCESGNGGEIPPTRAGPGTTRALAVRL